LHHRIATRLQVWLDLAAIVPYSQELPAPWEVSDEIEQQVWELAIANRPKAGGKDPRPTVQVIATSYLPFGIADEKLGKDARERFYSLFYSVRSLLSDLIDAHDKPGSKSALALLGATPGPLAGVVQTVPVCFIPVQHAVILGGIISFYEDSNWSLFKTAIAGVEVSRLRRCPVCCRIYYAIRANKRACDDHLALAAVWRARGKAPTYRSSRQFRQRAGLKGIRGRKRAEIVTLHDTLTRHGGEQDDE
jgi:hypothetical protein